MLVSTNLQKKLEALYRQLLALEAIYATQKITTFVPLPGDQTRFFTEDQASIRLVLGDNRSGKSTIGVCEAIAHSLGYRPWLTSDHPDYIVRLSNGRPIPVPNRGRVIAQDFEQAIKQNIWQKLQEWAPRGWYSVRKSGRGIPIGVNWKNGSEWFLMSDNQDDEDFEGTSGHWFWGDEPFGYNKYIALRRGLIDFSGHCWLTLTPLSQPWIYDVIQSRGNDPDGEVKVYDLSIWDNEISQGGHLSREAIKSFIADLREDQKAARIGHQWLHMTGRVYKEWKPEPPFWVEPFKIPDTWPRICVVDPHPKKPVAVVWLAINPDNQVYVYRELFNEHLVTIKDVASKIKELEGWTKSREGEWYQTAHSESVVMRIIDPASRQHERTSGQSVWSRFLMEGLTMLRAPKGNAEAGYDAIHEALKIRFEWGEPGLIVFNTCSTVKSNFLRFVWEIWRSSKDRDLKGERQEVRKSDDDMIDGIRYYFQSGLSYESLKSEMRNMTSKEELDNFEGVDLFTGEYSGGRFDRGRISPAKTY